MAQKQSSLGQVGKDDKGDGDGGSGLAPQRFDGPDLIPSNSVYSSPPGPRRIINAYRDP